MRGLQFPAWFAAMVAAFGLVLGLHAAPPASADDGARAFTQTLIDKGFGILRDTRVDKAARVAGFHAFIVEHMDARKTALFTLGNYRRGAPDGVVEAFGVRGARTFAYAVQFHPEWRCWETPFYTAIFEAFGHACRQRRSQRLQAADLARHTP